MLLEFRTRATPLLQAYVDSDGSAGARAALLDHEIWNPRYADGRNSKAMLNLLDNCACSSAPERT